MLLLNCVNSNTLGVL